MIALRLALDSTTREESLDFIRPLLFFLGRVASALSSVDKIILAFTSSALSVVITTVDKD